MENEIVGKKDIAKEKIILFVIGVLVGAVISTAVFLVYVKVIGVGSSNSSSLQQMPSGTPPEMPSGENGQSGQGQPPEKPSNENGQSGQGQSSEKMSGESGQSQSSGKSGNSNGNSQNQSTEKSGSSNNSQGNS